MGETLTVRLFVSTQTYDIPCDPREPAKWLLQQAKNIQRSSQSNNHHAKAKNEIQDELEVLYNRSRRLVINLDEPIGRNISSLDVIDARTLLQTPDTTSSSAMFPFLRSHPGGLKVTDENLNLANGLFFQQLYAYTLIGRRTPETVSQRREKQKKDDFLNLLKMYVVGTFEEEPHHPHHHSNGHDGSSPGQQHHPPAAYNPHNGSKTHHQQQQPTYYSRPLTPPAAPPVVSALHGTPARRATEYQTKSFFSSSTPTATHAVPIRRQIEYPPDPDSDSGSDHGEENTMTPRMAVATPGYAGRAALPPVSPAPAMATRRATTGGDNPLDEMENVFDIVFKQQAIGMKLGSDESKHAVVKECFEGSEAKKHPEIQNGVVILAVNGQEVSGLGLSRVLYRLREAPRPVVVRFGRVASRSLSDDQYHARTGTWG